MSQEDPYINGELLRLGREARGWVLGDMATRACMSVKQIRQLEEGGTSAFYSVAVKMTSAKKLAKILELPAEQVFSQPVPADAQETVSDALPSVAEDAPELHVPETEQVEAGVETQAAPPTVPQIAPEPELPPAAVAAPSPKADEPKSKTSLWMILGLFVAALAVAAYMQQQQEEISAEPPPPLQVVPEAEAAASAADAAASGASAPTGAAIIEPAAASTASSAAVASGPVPAVKPAASAASKPL